MLIAQSASELMTGFVVIEGIDGCGKSSVSKMVVRRIGKKAVLTREPTDSWIGDAVRKGDARRVSPYADALLFMADRAQHTMQISELLRKGKTVICDRYYYSTVAYQAANLEGIFDGDAFAWLLDANRRISIQPDLAVLLVVPPEVGLRRLSRRASLSRFEKLEFLKKVHKNYLKLAKLDRSVVKVDAKKDLQSVVAEVIDLIRERNL